MDKYINRGAKIIIKDWLHLKADERLLIITNKEYSREAEAMKYFALEVGSKVDIMTLDNLERKVGVYFDENERAFDDYNVIVGATQYSIVTTRATKRAIKRGSKFLSLPLSTSNGESMLGFDFMTVDTKKSKMLSSIVEKYFKNATTIRATTPAGTDLTMYMRNRKMGFFNGDVRDGKGYSSASIELYVPIEETKTNGIMVVDGSLGYIGKANEPTKIYIDDGMITEIENTPTGIRLEEYINHYNDDQVRYAGEFGLGLNSKSKCEGNCYIEDESAYGTFHIGFGRNIALGGNHQASGHYDLVCLEPDIYIDNRKIMEKGKLILPEPILW